MPLRRLLLLVLASFLLAGGCKDTAREALPEVTQPPKPPISYAAVGASETIGTGAEKPATEAWPRVLADKLGEGGRQVTFHTFAFGGASVPESLASSVPKVEALKPPPNLVTVWLNANDIIREVIFPGGTPYEQSLEQLVQRVRFGGATTVLVANTPALDKLPAYLGCLEPAGKCLLPAQVRNLVPPPEIVRAKVDAYNQAIERVVKRQGAVLVDLHGASLKARDEGRDAGLVSADGFHPSTAGHAAVAATFAEAAEKAGV